jgi:starch-binding outer membrane protein SusE/F
MKKNSIYLMLLFLLPLLAGCEDENKVILDLNQFTPTAITSPAYGSAFELLAENAEELIVLEFDPAIFEVDVATEYNLEMAADAEFADPVLLESAIDADNGRTSFTVVSWNKALLAADYEPIIEAPVYFRLVTRILDSEVRTYSNILPVNVTPYNIASDGSTDDGTRIYIVGAAVPAQWDPSAAIEMVNIAPDTYRATTTFSVERFRFLAQQDWGDGYNFPYFESVPEDLLENARQDDREDGDENLWFKGEPGDYVITVNLATKSITMEPATNDGTIDDGSRIYLVGAAAPEAGWDPTAAIEMINIAPNVYRATVDFINERFRFLAQQDWGDGYNFPYFTHYTSPLLENALQDDREDGDQNLWFKGEPGTYVVTVDLEKKTVEVDLPYSDDGTRVYLVGAAVVEAQWDPSAAVEMVNIAPNRYRATTDFVIERFRFLAQQDWGDGYNFPYFTSVPEQYLENALQDDREDGDQNLWFKGPNGTYTITIDLEEKWITMY